MDGLVRFANGYPLDTRHIEFLNKMAWHPTEALAAALGDNTIITGVEDDGNNISDGYIVYGGELLPFLGGSTQSRFEVVEVEHTGFYDGNLQPQVIARTRVARPTASGNGVLLSDLQRIGKVKDSLKMRTLGSVYVVNPAGQSVNGTFSGDLLDFQRIEPGDGTVYYELTLQDTYFSKSLIFTPNVRTREFPLIISKAGTSDKVQIYLPGASDADYVEFGLGIKILE